MTAVKIPYDQLSQEALQGVIEEFVTRDGTDYGDIDVSLETKIFQVLGQLKSGKAVMIFDQKSETCTILKSNDPALKGIED
ncbi:MAG: YheU family protein [Desulfobacterales bacterium]|nr:YheU family protein [Desulfobacterales bacterium]